MKKAGLNKHNKKKQHIYSVAARLFMEKGYPSSSMRDLANEVGLEPSSLYAHIKSKEEILQEICFDCANRFLDGIDRIGNSKTPVEEKLKALIALHVDIALGDPSSITVFNDEWRYLSEPYLSDFLALRKSYEKKFLQILDKGISEGELFATNPIILMNSLISSMRWIHWKHQPGYDRDELVNAISTIFLSGLNRKSKEEA